MAKQTIDVSKIKGFDEMSYEDKVKALMSYEFNDNLEELTATKDALDKQKRATDKASSEAADFKKKLREKMSADEQAEADRAAEIEALRAENEGYKKLSKISEFKTIALALGYSEELASKRATAMYENDFATMSEIDKQFLVAHDLEMKAQAVEKTNQPPVSGRTEKQDITAEQFKNMSYREMAELQESSPELYEQLSQN